MILSNLRARAWQVAAILSAVLAVAAVVGWAFSGWRAAASDSRADAAEARAEGLAKQLEDARKAVEAADVSAKASQGARDSAAQRQADRDERSARVEGYARDAGNTCVGSADILRELEEGSGDIRRAEDRLRGVGRTKGQEANGPRPD